MYQPVTWQVGTVTAIRSETAKVKSFTIRLPEWTSHRPGQHYDIRLTAVDGYQAQRSYSIASEPERSGEIDLTVERIEDGEVSTYLHDIVVPGDRVEVRGPIGGYFVWEASVGGPLFLVAGGSGVVPLMAMIRHRAATGPAIPARLLYSSRTPEDVIYRGELDGWDRARSGLEVIHTFTRRPPPDWTGFARRIDREMLAEVIRPFGTGLQAYICGPTLLVESAATGLAEQGIPPGNIRTERFGPTGGPS